MDKISSYTISPVYDFFTDILVLLENYGWHILFFVVVFAYIYNTRLQSYIEKWKRKKEEEEYAAKYHKNPDLLTSHLTAQQKYIEKLQDKYRKESEEYKKKQEEKEAQKREELLSKYNGTSGVRLGSKNNDKPSTSTKSDYFPLMGSGSSSNYKPPKKGKCGGGGCG